MSRYFETIAIREGVICHLGYHLQRMERALKRDLSLQGIEERIRSEILPPQGVWRLKLFYDVQGIEKIVCTPYAPRKISSFKIIESSIEYAHKMSDRTELEQLFLQREACDEILITHQGLLKDTSIANIALFIKGEWFTPKDPLLAGTTRARLLEQGVIKEALLQRGDLKRSEKIALLNAMIGMEIMDTFTFA